MKKLFLILFLIANTALAGTLNFNRLLVNQSMGASFNSSAIDTSAIQLASVQIVWSGGGAPVGDFTLQVSNDDVSPSNFSTYPGSSLSISGNSGDATYNVANLGYKWIRVSYARTSGTATASANLVTKME